MLKKILIFTMIMIMVCGSLAVAQQRLDYNGYIRSAKIYLQQTPKDYKAAAERCEDAIKFYPDKPPLEAHFLLGLIYAEKRLFPEMATEFDIVRDLCANSKDENVKKLCEKEDFIENMNMVLAQNWIEQYNGGVNALKRAREADTCKLIADSTEKATCQAAASETYAFAGEYFDLSTLIIPDSSQGWVNLGLVYYSTGDTAKALDNYRKALTINDKDLALLSNMSSIYFNMHKYDSAVIYFGKMLDLELNDQSRADVLYNMAFCMNSLDNLDSAIVLLGKVVEITPESADAIYNLGAFKIRKTAKFSTEIKAYREKAGEDNTKYRTEIDSLFTIVKGVYVDAIIDFEKVIKLQPDNLDALEWLGDAYYFLERWDEALTTFNKIIEYEPDNEYAWCQLLLLQLKKNDKAGIAEARKHCTQF